MKILQHLLLLLTPAITAGQGLELRFDTGELSQCRRFFAVQDGVPIDEAGFFCLTIDPAVTDSISASYATSNEWRLEETSAWFNTDQENLETNRQGVPRLDRLPFQSDNLIEEPVASFQFTLPLADLGVPACGGPIPLPAQGNNNNAPGTQVYGVAWASLIRLSDEETADGWADGVLPEEGDLWTLFNFTIECVLPVEPTPSPTLTPPTPAPVPPTPFPTPFPTPSPTTAVPKIPDGGMCDDNIDCASGSCSPQGFRLVSTGSSCTANTQCSTGACINGLCNTCQNAQTSNSILTQDFISTSFAAAQLTQSLQLGFQANPPAVTASQVNFYNSNTFNPSMVAKVDGVCYGIFAPQENAKNLATFGTLPLTVFQQTCQVHERAHSAYFMDQRQFFELQLAQCASTCAAGGGNPGTFPTVNRQGMTPIPPTLSIQNEVVSVQSILPAALLANACPIVLAGHGLGGATAVVGSMVLSDLQPTVITFGAPRTVSSGCSLLAPTARSQSHYRYVNAAFAPSYNTYLFDSIPQLGDGGSLSHYGTPILMEEMETIVHPLNDDTTRAHVYDNSNARDPTMDENLPSQMSLYSDNVAGLAMEPCFPVPAMSAWQEGHWCDFDDVCTTGRCRAFVTLGEGYSTGVCAIKAVEGEFCEANNDCVTESCNNGVCAAFNGGGVPAPPLQTFTPGTTPPVPAPGNPPPANPQTNPPGNVGTAPACAPCGSFSDCASGVCNTFSVPGAPGGSSSVCAETPSGTMSIGCFCTGEGNNEDCTEGRCEGDASGTLFLCFARLPACQDCDEPSDCESNNCIDGICGLESGELPQDCGGPPGNNAPPSDCFFCSENADCQDDGSVCMMGVCTLSSGLLADGCPCPPRNGDEACSSGACLRSDNGITFTCGSSLGK